MSGDKSIHELDRPYPSKQDNGSLIVYPANFDAMTPKQRDGWPDRAYARWRRTRAPWLLVPIVAGLAMGWLTQSAAAGVGTAGLGFDILGVWLLGEAVLVTDEEANSYRTWGGLALRGDLAKRDRRQAVFSLFVITIGFIGQFVALVMTTIPTR